MIDWRLVRTRLPAHIQRPDPNIYRSDNYVTVDFETTTVGKGAAVYADNRAVYAAWELGPGHPSSPQGTVLGEHFMHGRFGGEFDMGDLVAAIEAADFVVAHNAKFDLGWLKRCGVDLSRVVVFDTMLAEYVIGGNRFVWQQLSLERSCQRRLGEGKDTVISRMFKAGLCSTEIPASWLANYCKRDVRLARKLFLWQRECLYADVKLMNVLFTRCLATPVLADIEFNGMYLDSDAVLAKCEELEREYADIQNKLEEVTGGINTNSGPQLAEFLYGTLGFREAADRSGEPIRTDGGKPKTDGDTVAGLRATTARQRVFMELFVRSRELSNELTKYLRKFRDCCTENEGWLRGQFNQSNTRTHRLSSTGLEYSTQFQNFPRAYKPLFRARNAGWLIGEADGAQLEFRVAAHLGRDDVALADIRQGTDIHAVTAGVIGCSRQDAKPHTFKPLYGGRSGSPNERKYYEFFREKYKGITATQQEWINEVLATGQLRTEWGLIYYWPNTVMEKSGYVTNSTSICNYPVQAFATAEIIPVGLVYFWHYARAAGMELMVVNTVHDSIITELPPNEVDDFHSLAKVALIDEVYGYIKEVYDIDLVVPLGAGVLTGARWGDKASKASEVVYNATEDQYDTSTARNSNADQHEAVAG